MWSRLLSPHSQVQLNLGNVEILVSQGPTYNIHRESKCCLWKLTWNPRINHTAKVQGFITMQIHVHVPPCLFRRAVCLLSVSNSLQLKENFFWKFSLTIMYTMFICNICLLVLRVFFVFKSFPFNLLALRKSNKI